MRILIIFSVILAACSSIAPPEPASRALIIAHRGASGERPEHTLAAYERAIDQGADFIEPDLVITKDGVLIARHENDISGTTDVAARPEFADRRRTKIIDGERITGFFTEDFTLAEVKTLRARERLPDLRGTAHDGLYDIPTFDEIIALAQRRGAGIYPETKHPTYFRSIGKPLEPPLLAALEGARWTTKDAPVFIQSFETENLKMLSTQTGVRLVQLIGDPAAHPADGGPQTYGEMLTPDGLRAIARYADGIGPNKALLIQNGASTGLVPAAHAAGLLVHPWTFRAENMFLPTGFQDGQDPRTHGDLQGELCAHLALGVNGVFADHVAESIAARRTCQAI